MGGYGGGGAGGLANGLRVTPVCESRTLFRNGRRTKLPRGHFAPVCGVLRAFMWATRVETGTVYPHVPSSPYSLQSLDDAVDNTLRRLLSLRTST